MTPNLHQSSPPGADDAALTSDALCSSPIRQRWRDHFSHPPLFNDLGCFRVEPDPMAIANFMFPPFTGKGEGTAMLYINRRKPAADDIEVTYQWFPDRVERCAGFLGYSIETVTRALPHDPGAMIHLRIRNDHAVRQTLEVGIKLSGRMKHTVEGWASIGPAIDILDEQREHWQYRERPGAMVFTSDANAAQAHGTVPAPDDVEGKTLIYQLTLDPGETWELDYAVTIAETIDLAVARYEQITGDFAAVSKEQSALWDGKIQSAFLPGNDLYSGHLPTLVTEHAELTRLYHMTTLGCLVLRRDNPISKQGPAYVTLSPNYWTTASFLWDMMIAAPFYALLDPDRLRKHIEIWINAGVLECHATDYVTGRPIGNWYAVNSSAITRLSRDYLRYTGDFDWLDTQIHDRPIIDHLEEHAGMWKKYDHHGHGLADCGGVINLLECVSTYTHGVASFNSMWVRAQRDVAALRRLRGETGQAKALESEAAGLLQRVMKLYADGKGYWRCRQPDGSLQDVRHIYDFVAILESIADDLPDTLREEMFSNFVANHQTENWVRSLSAWDDDAHRAVRVDHQWTGAYASIPAQAINGLYRLGHGDHAFDWLRKIASVVEQGPVGQAHWVSPLFPAFRGGAWKSTYVEPYICDWTVSSNGVFPAMIIESVFGVEATLTEGLQFKGVTPALDAGAHLLNLRYQGRDYVVDHKGINPMT